MKLLAVNYHYCRREKTGKGIFPITPDELEFQIDELAKHFDFLSGPDVLEILENRTCPDGNYCVLTVDDGLKEQLDILDVFLKKGVPGIFYVISESIKRGQVVDAHKFHYVVSQVEEEELSSFFDREYQLDEMEFDSKKLQVKYPYDDMRMKTIKYFLNIVMSEAERSKALDQLFGSIVPDEQAFARDLYMSVDDLKRLAGLEMLGTHSSSHKALAKLDSDEMKADINSSIKYIEEYSKGQITSISYPYGNSGAVSDELGSISSELGLRFGFTMHKAFNDDADLLGHPMLLKRVSTNDAPGGSSESRKYVP